MANVRNSRKFRLYAAEVRDRCAADGVVLVAGEVEDILAASITQIANTLGVIRA